MPENIYRTFISSPDLLDWYTSGDWVRGDIELVRHHIFHARRNEDRSIPNYIYQQQQEIIRQNLAKQILRAQHSGNDYILAEVLLASLNCLATEHLEFRHQHIYVQFEKFEPWHNLLAFCNPLPLLAALAEEQVRQQNNFEAARHLLSDALRYSALPSPYDPSLDYLCCERPPSYSAQAARQSVEHSTLATTPECRGKLHELHMHWNGTSEADVVWLDCLAHPRKVTDNLKNKWVKFPHIRQYHRQHGMDGPHQFYRHFRLANWLREWMFTMVIANDMQNHNTQPGLSLRNLALALKYFAEDFSLGNSAANSANEHCRYMPPFLGYMEGRFKRAFKLCDYGKLQIEGELLLRVMCLIRQGHTMLPYLLHPYLLLSNRFTQMIVQQASQVGFDQFQAIADFGMRDNLEDNDYTKRFLQLHGMYGPSLSYVEGRIAPKLEPAKFKKLARRIIDDHAKVKKDNPDLALPEIGLVVHFIKKMEQNWTQCRFSLLRAESYKQARVLTEVCKHDPEIKKVLVGKDAANNEIHTPPEVYAPLFRYLNAQGITRTTYHVGEDYHHLLSGLRAVDEAINFLGMSSGDRLGHCTALGIAPKTWRRDLTGKLCCPRGAWLDNLVWMYKRLDKRNDFARMMQIVQDEIVSLYQEIYSPNKNDFPGIDNLYTAWQYRKLEPLLLKNFIDPDSPDGLVKHRPRYLDIHFDNEAKKLDEARVANSAAFDLFRKYHNKNLQKKYDEIIQVPDLFPDEIYLALQDEIITTMREKYILAEVMPTSNVRISFYKNYAEHHFAAWLAPHPTRPVPPVVIATDDPGIFSTTLRNEYSHVLRVLSRDRNLTTDSAYEIVRGIMENARAFSFRYQQ